jgi:hypothetical protein
MGDTTAIGNAGEHFVMAELLARGLQAFRADRSNTAYDLAVFSGEKHSLIRVKTATSDNLQWSAKKTGEIFLQMKKSSDFVAIVIIKSQTNPIRSAQVYIVPTVVVDREIRKCHAFWLAQSGEKQEARSASLHRGLVLSGNATATNIGRGYAIKWKRYLEAWHQLGVTKLPGVSVD